VVDEDVALGFGGDPAELMGVGAAEAAFERVGGPERVRRFAVGEIDEGPAVDQAAELSPDVDDPLVDAARVVDGDLGAVAAAGEGSLLVPSAEKFEGFPAASNL
jgi:hypothetical protein